MLINAGGVQVELLVERAAWLPASETLLVADLHLGKAQSFRRLGVPVPAGTTAAMLRRLDGLIERRMPRELIVLGDLLHGPLSQRGPAIDVLADWRARHAQVAVRMVRGNHDASAGDPPPACGIEVLNAPSIHAGLALCHEPDEPTGCFRVAGHVHPVVRILGRIDRIRVACFWLRPDALILPAFGEFTGGWPVAPQPGEQVFAVAGSDVILVPTSRHRARASRR